MSPRDDSIITDAIADAATQAGRDFVLNEPPMSHRELGIVRQHTRVIIAAALTAGLEETIRADERRQLADLGIANGHLTELQADWIETLDGDQ